jgi:hypothetical protein
MLAKLVDDLHDWWATVSPEFAFLLALPFFVAACGLWADCRRRRGQ